MVLLLSDLICLNLFFCFFYPWQDISKYDLNGNKEQLVIIRDDDGGLSGPSYLRYEKHLLFGFKCSTLLELNDDYNYEFNIDEMIKKTNNSKTKIICHRDLYPDTGYILDW